MSFYNVFKEKHCKDKNVKKCKKRAVNKKKRKNVFTAMLLLTLRPENQSPCAAESYLADVEELQGEDVIDAT